MTSSSVLDTRTAIFVISGNQGAGKSTVARALARRFERGVYIEADALQKMIVSGGRWPESRDMCGEEQRQLRLRLHNACVLERSFFEAGFTAVIEDIVIGERVAHLVDEFGGQSIIFVMLSPSAEAIEERESGRGTKLYEEWSWMDDEIPSRTERIGLWLDGSAQLVEEMVDEIMRRTWAEGIVTPGADAARS